MEFEVEIEKGKNCKVVMEALNFGQRNDALRKATTVNLMTKQASVDTIAFGEWRLVYTIKSMDMVGWKNAGTNEDLKIKFIRGLSLKVGDKLSVQEQNLNLGVSEDDKKK